MAANKKIEEALDHIKIAEKSMKTSMLKWRPDYEIAADEYQKAATCFKNAKSFEQCKDCLLKAAEVHKQKRSLFHAAKCLDQALHLSKDLGDFRDVMQLALRAANMFQQHGSPDSAASCLERAGKLLEPHSPEEALRIYQRAVEVVLIEDNPRQGAEYVSKVSRCLLKMKMYDQAADSVRREIGLHQQSENIAAIGRLAVVLVLVQLARGDTVAAEKAFKEWGNCCDPAEVQTLEMLLQAYDEEDARGARAALNSSFIKHMDVEYARLARDLPLPQGEMPVSKPSVRENAAPSYVSPAAAPSYVSPAAATHSEVIPEGKKPSAEPSESQSHHSDDEYEGGLC